jgi:ATP-dependent RNA helicase RhlE
VSGGCNVPEVVGRSCGRGSIGLFLYLCTSFRINHIKTAFFTPHFSGGIHLNNAFKSSAAQNPIMSFEKLNLIEPLLRALNTEGYTTPTPIQEQSIPISLERRDLLACAQTGTGKTAAFTLPILQLLHQDELFVKGPAGIKALILTPTRELAIQIGESIAAYGKYLRIRHTVIFGGVPQRSQTDALRAGVEILVATPGRLLDLMDQRFVKLQNLKVLVLDEADRMLDMGFIHDVKKVIAKVPTQRQTLFFSATMPPEIAKLADTILTNPQRVEVTPVSSTANTIQQSVFFVEKRDKKKLLLHLLKDQSIATALVFARTKHGADRVAKDLNQAGVRAEAIHGNKSQGARQRALSNFKSQHTRVLVATDIAARGIDVEDLSTVINYELPNVPETYVHRIGRTGRAGASGVSYSFCDEEEKEYLSDIHKLIKKTIPVVEDHPYPLLHAGMPKANVAPAQRQGNNGNQQRRQGPGGGNRSRRTGGQGQAARSGNGRDGGRRSADHPDLSQPAGNTPAQRPDNKDNGGRSENGRHAGGRPDNRNQGGRSENKNNAGRSGNGNAGNGRHSGRSGNGHSSGRPGNANPSQPGHSNNAGRTQAKNSDQPAKSNQSEWSSLSDSQSDLDWGGGLHLSYE